MDKKIEKNRLLTRIHMRRYRTARTIFYSRPESHGRCIIHRCIIQIKYNFIIQMFLKIT